MKAEKIKRQLKNLLPWRARLGIELYAEKHPGILPPALRQKSDVHQYKRILYSTLKQAEKIDVKDLCICEMGSGSWFSHAAMAYQLGAKRTVLLEIEDFANQERLVEEEEISLDADCVTALRPLPPWQGMRWKEYFLPINTEYYPNGLQGYRAVPDDSVDFLFSHTVLQHIRKNVFEQTIAETARFTKSGATVLHRVDLRDCFGGKKNNLRFSDKEWEDGLHYKLGNYTNRLSCSEICACMERHGFIVEKCCRDMFDEMPIKRSQLSTEFYAMSDEDLMTKGFTVIAKLL